MQGPYGSYHLSESVLQILWNNGDFLRDELETESGKKICVIHTGRWNSFEGPDFLEAIIEMDGRRLVGSVEIHFKADDWYAHRHESNPLYRDVILHVVLFKPKSNASYVYFSDQAIETLTLMPHLKVDLESYALNLALLSFEGFNPSIKNNKLALEFLQKFKTNDYEPLLEYFDNYMNYEDYVKRKSVKQDFRTISINRLSMDEYKLRWNYFKEKKYDFLNSYFQSKRDSLKVLDEQNSFTVTYDLSAWDGNPYFVLYVKMLKHDWYVIMSSDYQTSRHEFSLIKI